MSLQEDALDRAIQDAESDDLAMQIRGMVALRKVLSNPESPPIDQLIAAGVTELAARALESSPDNSLRYEAAWVLTNIASGTSEHVKPVMASGALKSAMRWMKLPQAVRREAAAGEDMEVDDDEEMEDAAQPDGATSDAFDATEDQFVEQMIWLFGNVAGDSSDCRDAVIDHGVAQRLAEMLAQWRATAAKKRAVPRWVRTGAWLASNLCRGKPPVDCDSVACLIQPITNLLVFSEDKDLQTDSAWCLAYLAESDAGAIVSTMLTLNHFIQYT
jgi:importin subunit alpha-1